MIVKYPVLLTPENPENWIYDTQSDYTAFYKGILLANAEDMQYYEEVTDEWKREHEPQPDQDQDQAVSEQEQE